MQRHAEPRDGSRTLTVDQPQPTASTSSSVGTLLLRGQHDASKPRERAVVWQEGTVDNEFLNRKKSKICCIYHKPRPFDESSSDESSSDDQGDHGPERKDADGNPIARRKKKVHRKHGHHHAGGEDGCGGGGPGAEGGRPSGSGSVNKLDGGGRRS